MLGMVVFEKKHCPETTWAEAAGRFAGGGRSLALVKTVHSGQN